MEAAVRASIQAWEKADYATAIRELKQACVLSPSDPELRYNLGVMLLAVGKTQASKTEFERALKLQPGHVDSLYNLGRLLVSLGRVEEGISHLESAATLAGGDPGPGLAIVVAEVERGQVEAAWKRALRIEAKSAEVLSMLAYLSIRRGHPSEALDHARRAQQIEPAVQRHRLVLAHALIADNQLGEALDVIAIAERNSTTPLANVPYLRGLVAFLKLNFRESEAFWRAAVKLAPAVFSKPSHASNRVAFPLDADLAYLNAMTTLMGGAEARDLYSHLSISSGCKPSEVARGLYAKRLQVGECYRGGLTYDLDLDVRTGRVRKVELQTRTRVERCLQRALKGMPVRDAKSCHVRVRVGQSMLQD